MRPNVAMDAPPTSIEVGGFSYICKTDFRVWIEVLNLMRKLSSKAETEEKQLEQVRIIEEIETLVFGGVLADERLDDVFSGISKFAQGYPSAPMEGGVTSERTYSYEYDLNEIIIAIKNQHGVDLTWQGGECHWWMFLLYFHTLCGEHYITNLMQARGYKGKDKEMLRRKAQVALPPEYSAEEQAEMDAFNALFEPKMEEQYED